MLDKIRANLVFKNYLKRPNINKAYAMVKPTDSWYDTITKIHNSLKRIQALPHDIIEITSHDNLKLKGVYYPSDKKSNVTVICVHGYASHAEREWAFPGLFYLSLGYNVLITYQRAHGLSEGKYITFGALEYKDMLKWVSKINEMNPNDNIIIHGLSIGGKIALDLADKNMKNVKGIIADAARVSIEGFFKAVTQQMYKKSSDKVMLYFNERFNQEFGVDIKEYETINIVSNSKYPIFLTAGSSENREEIYMKIKDVNPKYTEIVILPGCGHGNGMYKQTDMYQSALKEFIHKKALARM